MRNDVATLDVVGIVRINNSDYARKNMDQAQTYMHEMMHLAYNSGMFTTQEMDALINKYSDPKRSAIQQSEDFAQTAKFWEEPNMIQRFTDWINRFASKLTGGRIKLNGEAVRRLIYSENFWQRPAQSIHDFQSREGARQQGFPPLPEIQPMADQEFTGERDNLAIPTKPTKARIAYNVADANRVGFKKSHQEVINEVNTRRAGPDAQRQAADEKAIARWRDPSQMFDVVDHEHIIRLSTELAMSGNAADYAKSIELIELKRERVAEVARVLGYGRDPLSRTPTERRKNATKDAVFEPDRQTKDRLKHLAPGLGEGAGPGLGPGQGAGLGAGQGAGRGPGKGPGKGPGTGQQKVTDPKKAEAAQKAWEKERQRLKKIEKFMTELGY